MRVIGQRPWVRAIGVLAVLLVIGQAAGAARAAQYAAIVMDMRDGRVYAATAPDRRQPPASLTKMMTLYLTFEALEAGLIRLDQKVRISRHAAGQPPSKLYLKAGQRVTIRSLIRAAAIKSANDAAVALAEAVGGSEKEFARLMTAKAHALGMSRTTFRNATGLTRRGHLSTARDMALLGRYLYFDFPQYFNIFGRKTTYAAGKRIWSTNRLLRTYRGADGIKTGYTAAAGYNLVATARRGQERIIAVVMGGKSGRWRNGRMRQLLDLGFRRAPTRVAMVPPGTVAVARAPLPPVKPTAPATGIAALARVIVPPAAAATVDPGSPYAPLYAQLPPVRPDRGSGGDESSVAATIVGTPVPGVPLPPPRPVWAIEVGTFADPAVAVANVSAVSLGGLADLADASPVIEMERGAAGTPLYHVRFVGLAPQRVGHACAELAKAGHVCTPLPPGS